MATGRDVVGADGLTNAERYKKRQEEKAAKAAARKAKQAEIDKDRPEGVSRYLWEKVLKGDDNFNPALVSKNPEISDAIAATGNEDWVKAIHEKSMEEAAGHYVGNGADPAAALATAQNPWYNKNYGTYVPPEPVVKEAAAVKPSPGANPGKGQATGGGRGPGGMFGGLTDVVQGTRPPEPTPPVGGAITGPTYEEQLAAAQAAQKAAYEEQLAAMQAQYDQQRSDAEAARQAEIDRRAAEVQAKKEANNAAWGNANAAAAGVASSAPSYTQKYGEGSTAGGLMSGVNSVRNPQGDSTGGGFNPSHDVWPVDSAPKQESTPWADAFLRSKQAAEAPGAVSGMMKKWME
jgi:hypothetical protein